MFAQRGGNNGHERDDENGSDLNAARVQCQYRIQSRRLKKALLRRKALEAEIIRLQRQLSVTNWNIASKQDTIDQLTKLVRVNVNGPQPSSSPKPRREMVLMKREVSRDPIQEEKDNQGVRNAELIFPEEVWGMIFDNLTEPEDFWNCIATCQLFKNVLHSAKPKFLFPEAFPLICHHLDNQLVLNCRRVCKTWNAGVDDYAENHPAIRPYDEKNFTPRYPNLAPPLRIIEKNDKRNFYQFTNIGNDLRQHDFLEKMRDHPRNPFVGRALTILTYHHQVQVVMEGLELPYFLPPEEAVGIPLEQQQETFWQSLSEFLKTFGEHIWYVDFENCWNHPMLIANGVSMAHLFIHKIFTYCRNLRRLRTTGFWECDSTWFCKVFKFNLLPTAPKLETLAMNNMYILNSDTGLRNYDFKGSMVEILLQKYCKQLKRLHVEWDDWKDVFESDLEWSSLTELHISELIGEVDIQPLLQSRLPSLKKVRFSNYTGGLELETIMKAIIGLSATTNIHAVRIYDIQVKPKNVANMSPIMFAPPSLKTLEVEVTELESWRLEFSFLLRFPFIENLIIFWQMTDTFAFPAYEYDYRDVSTTTRTTPFPCNEWSKVVKLRSFIVQKRMYECDIWELLPRLKVFTYQRDVYTREGYNRFLQGKNAKKGSL